MGGTVLLVCLCVVTVWGQSTSPPNPTSSTSTIICTTSNWRVTNQTINVHIQGLFTTATAVYSNDSSPVDGSVDNGTVSFSHLSPGSTYTVSLWYQLNTERLEQCTHTVTLVPALVTGLRCEYSSGGYALALVWGDPVGVRTGVQVNMSGKSFTENGNRLEISDLQPAQWYHLTVTSLSGEMRSESVSISCQTDPRGVIAGSVIGIILLIVLCTVGIWFLHRTFVFHRSSSNEQNVRSSPTPNAEGIYEDPDVQQTDTSLSVLPKSLSQCCDIGEFQKQEKNLSENEDGLTSTYVNTSSVTDSKGQLQHPKNDTKQGEYIYETVII